MNVEKMTGQSTAKLPPAPTESSTREERSGSEATPPWPSPGNPYALSRRRQSKSGPLDSPYLSRPRMKRRGAVSYDRSDTTAEYIRYLGKY